MTATRLRDLRRHIVDVHLRSLPDALLDLGAIHQQMHAHRSWNHLHPTIARRRPPEAGIEPRTAPERDTPCCPSCGGDVEEITTGTARGMYRCLTGKTDWCASLARFEDLAWRA